MQAVRVEREPLDQWFAREILCHEAPLTRFLASFWPDRDELADLRQEAYTRVYEASRASRPQWPRAFLFATARHLMADLARRKRVVSISTYDEGEYSDLLVDEISPERNVAATAELHRLARALGQLSPKSLEVVWLRRVRELSQREVAQHLRLSQKTVEKHLRTGSRRLAQLMRRS